MGWLYLGSSRVSFAIEAFEHALALGPTDEFGAAVIQRGLGMSQMRLNNHEQATTHYQNAIAIAPSDWRGYAGLGHHYWQLGKYEDAAEAFRRGAMAVRTNPDLYSNLAGMLTMLGRRDEASDALLQALAIRPTAGILANAGTNYFYMGRYDDARGMYERALELQPERYEHHGNLANVCLRLPGAERCSETHHRTAIEMAEKRLRHDPDDWRTWARLAQYRSRIGDMDGAMRDIEQALALNESSDYVLQAAAVVHTLGGDHDRAYRFIERAIESGYPRLLVTQHPDLAVVLAVKQ